MPKSKEQKQLEAKVRNLTNDIDVLEYRVRQAESFKGVPLALSSHERWLVSALEESKEKLAAAKTRLQEVKTRLDLIVKPQGE